MKQNTVTGAPLADVDEIAALLAPVFAEKAPIQAFFPADKAAENEDTLTEQKHFTPYLGITFDVTPNQSLYASYTSIFKPSYGKKDKQGKQIKPKTGNNLEIGWKGAWYANRLNASVALFQIDEKNRPFNITKAQAQAEDPSATRGYTIPFGKVRSHGWETEISGKLTDNW